MFNIKMSNKERPIKVGYNKAEYFKVQYYRVEYHWVEFNKVVCPFGFIFTF